MITTTNSFIKYTGNGATASFAFPYAFFATTDLYVIQTDPTTLVDTVNVLGPDYTVTVVGSSPYYAGGTIVFGAAPANGQFITIIRIVSPVQLSQYLQNSGFPTPTLEQSLDYLTLICQMLAENLTRCIQTNIGDTRGLSLTIPPTPSRLNTTLAFDGTGNLIVQ